MKITKHRCCSARRPRRSNRRRHSRNSFFASSLAREKAKIINLIKNRLIWGDFCLTLYFPAKIW